MAKQNILIIEDDQFFRELITKTLVAGEFAVFGAIDGEKGIEKAKQTKPDLILLDLLLPNVSGFEVLSSLKADDATASIPIIILSNLDSSEDIEKGLKLGAAAFLIKSKLNSNEIIEKIKSVLK
jgi:DNA-binding response OmpR family regulator